jgi:hypothetical protein
MHERQVHPMAFTFDDAVHLLGRVSDGDVSSASSHPARRREDRTVETYPSPVGVNGSQAQ